MLQKVESPSPFLWPKGEIDWQRRFSKFLQEEAREHLKTAVTVSSYRHAAIAISRVHLKCGGFKKDYGIEEKRRKSITSLLIPHGPPVPFTPGDWKKLRDLSMHDELSFDKLAVNGMHF